MILNGFLNISERIGHGVCEMLRVIGRISLFISNTISAAFTAPFYPKILWQQFINIGYYSLPVVGLTAIFTGMVLALQSYTGFSRFNAESAVASVVVLSITRELAPVLAGLMVAGRVGAAIAAEIGTMRVTEQIDAMVTLAVNPFKYLIAPRVIAGVITLPLLVLVGDLIGVFGGFLVSTYVLGFNPVVYIQDSWNFVQTIDIVSGLVKAGVFGFIVTLLGCYNGFKSRGGALGVGTATTNAVVSASILILVFNYFITQIFFS